MQETIFNKHIQLPFKQMLVKSNNQNYYQHQQQYRRICSHVVDICHSVMLSEVRSHLLCIQEDSLLFSNQWRTFQVKLICLVQKIIQSEHLFEIVKYWSNSVTNTENMRREGNLRNHDQIYVKSFLYYLYYKKTIKINNWIAS